MEMESHNSARRVRNDVLSKQVAESTLFFLSICFFDDAHAGDSNTNLGTGRSRPLDSPRPWSILPDGEGGPNQAGTRAQLAAAQGGQGPVVVLLDEPIARRARGRRRIYQELVSRIENGAANPELDTLGKIAGALGVHPRELLEE